MTGVSVAGARSACFHCGQDIPQGIQLELSILGESRKMCCHGCFAVADAIVSNGLDAYYTHRTVTAGRPDELVPAELRELEVYDNDVLQSSFVSIRPDQLKEASLILEGIVCAACVWVNERFVRALPGVQDFSVNYSNHRARLVWDNSQIRLSDVLAAIASIGYHAHPFDPKRQAEIHKKERASAIRKLGVAGVGAMQVMMLAMAMYIGDHQGMADNIRTLMRWASLVITLPVLAYSAQTFFTAAWRDLKRFRLGMDVPVSLAILGAFSASVWHTWLGQGEVYYDSVTMFTFLLLLGRFMELAARHRAGEVADELVKLIPSTAHRQTPDGFESVPVASLAVGDILLIKPGEAVPADGLVIEGVSSVEESLLTGESLPRARSEGHSLIGGTVNIESPLLMRVEKLGADTVLASISRLLEQAQAEKPAVAELANKVAAWFVAALLVVASAVYWFWLQHNPSHAFAITLSVLVVTCPCALSLATPVALTAVTGALTKLGVLVSRGSALESFAQVTDIVFDKTGTLTKGKLSLSGIELRSDLSEAEARAIAAGLEVFSEHPIAAAIRAGVEPATCQDVQVQTGKGVSGSHAGVTYHLGSRAFVASLPGFSCSLDSVLEPTDTLIFLARNDCLVAVFSIRDTLRSDAIETLGRLRQLGVEPHLLSGDLNPVVSSVAKTLTVEQWRGEQLPLDKLGYIKALQAQGKVVAMVGDGVNDAPVLAAAHVSIAMGNGAQLAQATSDVILLSEHLTHLADAVEKSRQTLRIIRQNLSWAVGYNLVALPLAAAGFVAPWMAAIGMSLSSLIVVLNALRLKGGRIGGRGLTSLLKPEQAV